MTGFAGLVGLETRRIMARRMVRVLLILALAGIVIGGLATFLNSAPLAPEAAARMDSYRERQQAFESCMQQSIPQGPIDERLLTQQYEECRIASGFDETIAFQQDDVFFLTSMTDILKGTTVPLMLIAWIIGATMIGAEWAAGTVGVQLTWEPRRFRLLAAKGLAVVLVAAGLAILLQELLTLSLLPAAFARGTTAGADKAWVLTLTGVVLRSAAIAAIAGLLGFSLGSIGRNTAAALGIGFGYLVVVENLLAGLLPRTRPWLLVGNIIAFISGSNDLGDGIVGHTVMEAGILLAVYAVGAFAVAASLFTQRDIG